MPVYKKEQFIVDAIQSVLNQKYKNIELIIIDDNTPKQHGIRKIIDYFQKKSKRLKYFKNNKNMGVAYCRNRAIQEATGDIICVQDSDDMSMELRATIVNNYFKRHKDVNIMYGSCHMIDHSNGFMGSLDAVDFNIHEQKTNNYISHPTVAYRKNIGVQYRKGRRYIDDWYFYMDCFLAGKRFGWVSEYLSFYRVLKDSLSRINGKMNRTMNKEKQKYINTFKNIEKDITKNIENSGIQKKRIALISKFVPFKSNVLELGCNAGYIIQKLKKDKKCSIMGVEISKNLVDICKRKKLNVIQDNILSYRDKIKRDIIIIADVIEHYYKKDAQLILNNALSMLKKSGTMIITVPYEFGIYSKESMKDHAENYNLNDFKKLMPHMNIKSYPIIDKYLAVPIWIVLKIRF